MRKALIIILTALLCVALCVSCKQDPPEPTYVVSFNANGGRGIMKDQGTSESSIRLNPITFDNPGYKFAGWSLSATEAVYCEDEATIPLSSNVTLYAKWIPISYIIHFDRNEGHGVMEDVRVYYGMLMPLPKNEFTNGGKFKNWSTTADGVGGTFYEDKESVRNLADKDGEIVTLYAQWGNPKIYFNSNGGFNSMDPQEVEPDTMTHLNHNLFERNGWHFDKWCVSPVGTGTTYEDEGEINTYKDMILYAQWAPNTYTVKFEPGDGTGTMADETFTYHESQELSKNSFKAPEGMFFVNWKVKDSDPAKYYMDGEKVCDLTTVNEGVVTLEAQWGEGLYYRKKVLVWQKGMTTYEYQECAVGKSTVTMLTNDSKTMTAGWYAVDGDVTVNERMVATGDVHLILFDGATLTAEKGIKVDEGSSLTIYDRDGGTGKLVVSTPDKGQAGIGGGSDKSGAITIHGGILEIKGGDDAAAIGGNSESSNGKIVIYGGKITANSGEFGAGIGSGFKADAGEIAIYGGEITAKAIWGAGIGAGTEGNNTTILIAGDAVINAEGGIPVGGKPKEGDGEASAGIGGAGSRHAGNIIILGGTITAKGGIRPEFQFGPELLGSGIGGGDIDNKGLYGNVEYASNIKVEVSSDGKKWKNYDGTKPKQYMRTYVVN
ncbi:MAG: InlB B-repeat-containing protein [Spirochaetales bacterium]|nr:InlB B-repeat-containing protein [Spirochaetales bacterium]